MKETKIKLESLEAVKEFVSAAEKCSFDIDVQYNRIIVDAKSFLAVLSLIRNPLLISSRGYDAAFEKTLEKFAVC